MSDSNATELLRELLDERGVEYVTVDLGDELNVLTWLSGDAAWYYVAEQQRLFGESVTPEQAVAATLGSGTLTAEQVSKATYAHSIHADCADADWQAIADELNATLGSGECENIAKYWGEFECSECDTWAEFGSDLHIVNYCPHCGRRVKR